MNEEKRFDPIHLYIRTDEKFEEVRAEVHDVKLDQKDLRNSIDRIEKRVDFGVSVTGQKNSSEIGLQAVEIGKLKQTQEIQDLKLETIEATLNDKLDKVIKAVDLIYKGIVGIFFTLICGGGVLYALKFFHFS